MVHKQDFFTRERYRTPRKEGDEEPSFLSRSSERFFNERPYLDHRCYLFLTKTTRERMRTQSNASTLCRGFLVPREVGDPEAVERFLDAVGQAESILRESGMLQLTRMKEEQIVGTSEAPGILEHYFALERSPLENEDLRLDPGRMMIGDKILSMHTLSDLDDLPQTAPTDARYERLSTDRSDCRLSFAASSVGMPQQTMKKKVNEHVIC